MWDATVYGTHNGRIQAFEGHCGYRSSRDVDTGRLKAIPCDRANWIDQRQYIGQFIGPRRRCIDVTERHRRRLSGNDPIYLVRTRRGWLNSSTADVVCVLDVCRRHVMRSTLQPLIFARGEVGPWQHTVVDMARALLYRVVYTYLPSFIIETNIYVRFEWWWWWWWRESPTFMSAFDYERIVVCGAAAARERPRWTTLSSRVNGTACTEGCDWTYTVSRSAACRAHDAEKLVNRRNGSIYLFDDEARISVMVFGLPQSSMVALYISSIYCITVVCSRADRKVVHIVLDYHKRLPSVINVVVYPRFHVWPFYRGLVVKNKLRIESLYSATYSVSTWSRYRGWAGVP